MTTSLADQILTQLGASPAPAADAPSPSAISPPASTALSRLPLAALRIDPHQPRRYLPHDLRAEVVHGGDPRQALRALIERAGAGDAVAVGYLDGIRGLAKSIADVGLQQPIRASAEKDGTFRIVDGERRFWAALFLRETAGDARYDAIDAILHDPEASADDVQRAQWAANLCREDVPAVDFAEAVWHIREGYLAHLAQDRARAVAELGAAAEGMTTPELALALTQREVARLTSRTLSERHLYTHLAIAERLKPQAKALARAHRVGVRQLSGIVRLPEAEQLRLIARMAGLAEPAAARPAEPAPSRPGRPTSLQRGINACIDLADALGKLTERNLARQAPADVQALLDELDAAAAGIDRLRRLVRETRGFDGNKPDGAPRSL